MFGGESQKHELLREVPFFRNLSKQSLEEIAKITDEVHQKAGAVLAQQGDIGQEFIFIMEGEAKVEKDGNIVNKLAPHGFFGEISIIDGQPRTATVTAETDVKLLVIHSRYFKELLEKVPGLAIEALTALCKYLREAQAKNA